MHLEIPILVAAVLAGLGTYGMLARRSLVLVLVSAELLLNAAALLLLTGELAHPAPGTGREAMLSGQSMTMFLITLAAAEIGLALAIVLAVFRVRSTADVVELRELAESAQDVDGSAAEGGAQ